MPYSIKRRTRALVHHYTYVRTGTIFVFCYRLYNIPDAYYTRRYVAHGTHAVNKYYT